MKTAVSKKHVTIMKNKDLILASLDFWEFYIQFNKAISEQIEKHNLTLSDLLVLPIALTNFKINPSPPKS